MLLNQVNISIYAFPIINYTRIRNKCEVFLSRLFVLDNLIRFSNPIELF